MTVDRTRNGEPLLMDHTFIRRSLYSIEIIASNVISQIYCSHAVFLYSNIKHRKGVWMDMDDNQKFFSTRVVKLELVNGREPSLIEWSDYLKMMACIIVNNMYLLAKDKSNLIVV